MQLGKTSCIQQATALLSKLQGFLVWSVHCSEFGVLSLNFGEPHLSIHGPYRSSPSSSAKVKAALGRRLVKPTGDWHLFVEDADWEAVGGPYKASRTSKASERDQVLDQLDGQRLLDFRFDQQTAQWFLTFDLGGILVIGSPKQDGAEVGNERDESLWTLFFWDAGNATWTLDGRLVFESRPDKPHVVA